VVRGKGYLNWRYGGPGANYTLLVAEKAGKISGYVVLAHRIESGIKASYIFDLMAQSEEVMHSLVSKAVENSRLSNADVMLCPLIADKTYRRILRRNGFISLPFVKGGWFLVYCSSPFVSKDLLKDPRHWSVQIGDSDRV